MSSTCHLWQTPPIPIFSVNTTRSRDPGTCLFWVLTLPRNLSKDKVPEIHCQSIEAGIKRQETALSYSSAVKKMKYYEVF